MREFTVISKLFNKWIQGLQKLVRNLWENPIEFKDETIRSPIGICLAAFWVRTRFLDPYMGRFPSSQIWDYLQVQKSVLGKRVKQDGLKGGEGGTDAYNSPTPLFLHHEN